MTDVEVRLDSLRLAATDIQQASRAISEALDAVQAEVTALYALGLPGGGVGVFSASYAASASIMQEWPFKLTRFATNLEQAIDRSGTKAGNKGWDVTLCAIEMVSLCKQI